MSVEIIGAGGNGGLALGPHAVDVNTVEHWELGSDVLGDVNGALHDFDGGIHRQVYFPGSVSSVCTSLETAIASERLRGPNSLAGLYAREVTYAALVFAAERPGGATKRHLWRYENINGGVSDLQVFMTTDPVTGVIRVGHVSTNALTFESDDLALAIPVGEWCHVVFTRSAAGNTGRVWVNGVGENWSTPNPPDTTNVNVSTELCLGNNTNGTTTSPFSIYSLIVKNVEVNDSDVAALLAQTGLPV